LESGAVGAALQGSCLALSGRWTCCVSGYPGRRCALPWADMLRPLWGKEAQDDAAGQYSFRAIERERHKFAIVCIRPSNATGMPISKAF
jgi:hypothetical protein